MSGYATLKWCDNKSLSNADMQTFCKSCAQYFKEHIWRLGIFHQLKPIAYTCIHRNIETDEAGKNYTKSRRGEERNDQATIELMQLHNCNTIYIVLSKHSTVLLPSFIKNYERSDGKGDSTDTLPQHVF